MKQQFNTFRFDTATIDKNNSIKEQSSIAARCFILEFDAGVNLEMVEIPGGSFPMGALASEIGSRENERPVHQVNVSSFFMSKFPITQAQWLAIIPTLPQMGNKFYGSELPVVNVWLEKALEFCRRLKELTNLPFRLPSEAEWEYACRAGTTTPFSFGQSITTDFANFNGQLPYNNSSSGIFKQQTTPIGYFPFANGFGLFDMHGNVWEWCADIWHEDYTGAPSDNRAWLTSGDHSYCVQRGGSWLDGANRCRSAYRVGDVAHNTDNIVGLRLCLSKEN